jgi:hypothetical protein
MKKAKTNCHRKAKSSKKVFKEEAIELSTSKCSAIPSWKVKDKTISTGAIKLCTYEGKELFAILDEKLLIGLDTKLQTAFTNALDKGIAKKTKGANGVKILNNLYELKINGDNRLYTNKIFKNPEGNLLIIFDNIGNHESVKNTNQKCELVHEYVTSRESSEIEFFSEHETAEISEMPLEDFSSNTKLSGES